jgi:hypothetical protein
VYAEILETMEEQTAHLNDLDKRIDKVTDCLGMPISTILDLK